MTLGLSTGAPGAVAPPKAAKDMLVGAYYFPGWNKPEKWNCIAANKEVEHPLLGYYREGDPEAAEWHIKWALEHGVSFFAFDFYTANGSQMLETALDEGFLRAKSMGKFKFCLNWCNHAPESTMTAEQLDKFGDLVIKKYLTHPSYLRIEGKPVVIFLVGHAFIRNLGLDGAKQAFGRFEQKAKEAGLPGLYLAFCEDAMGPNEVQGCKSIGVSAFCRYNYPYAGTGVNGPTKHAEFSYQHLSEEGEKMWKEWQGITGGESWPTVMPGWDRRPWTKDTDVVITGSTPELFAQSLSKARNYVSKDRVVLIEAWNEWGEGSVLEPSVERGFGYLDAVRKVFRPKAGSHKDVDSKSLGRRPPVLEAKLPLIDIWGFDSDAEGWTSGGMSNVHNDWGAFAGSTTTADPTMTSPATYIQCNRYSKAKIRMLASAHAMKIPASSSGGSPSPSKGAASETPTEATGHIFWSTAEHGITGESSMPFKVYLDSQWHEYELNLASNPNWKGLTDRLRFDPVDRAGVDILIDEIRVVK